MILLADARPLHDPSSGGVKRVARGLLHTLQATAGTNTLLLGATGMQPCKEDHLHRRVPNKYVNACALAGTSYAEWFDKKADALFFPNLAWTGVPNIPYSVLVHDLSFLIEPRWFSRKSRIWHALAQPKRFFQKADHLFAVSERTKADLINLIGVDQSRISVIPMGIEPLKEHVSRNTYHVTSNTSDASSFTLQASRATPFLLALGLGDPRKNVACAIQAWRMARKTFPELKLVLIGPGKLTPEPGITVHPSPTDVELSNLMQYASAFLYPSWYEGFGLPLHEAAFFGTPCIASTAGSLPETAPTGTLFAPPHKPHLWAVAIQTILKNKTAYKTQTQTRTWDEAAKMIWGEMNV